MNIRRSKFLGRPGFKFLDRIMWELAYNVPGEIETALVEMTTVDQLMLEKSYSGKEYLQATRNTLGIAFLTTFKATGVTHPFVAGTRSPVSPTELSREDAAPQPQETSQKLFKDIQLPPGQDAKNLYKQATAV